MADPSFCGIPIYIRDDIPVGCIVMVSGDGRQVTLPIRLAWRVAMSNMIVEIGDDGKVKIPGLDL